MSSSLARDRAGNFGLVFALMLVPMVGAVGAALDFARAYDMQTKMQYDLDAALLSAVQAVTKIDENSLKSAVIKTFNAQTSAAGKDKLSAASVKVDKATSKITATVTVSVPTTFLAILGKKKIDVTSVSTAMGGETETKSSVSMYLVLDRSGSMAWNTNTMYTGTCLNSKKVLVSCTQYFTKIASLIMAVGNLLTEMAKADPNAEYVRTGAIAYDGSARTPSPLAWGVTAASTYVTALTASGSTDSSGAIKIAYDSLVAASENSAHLAKSGQKPVKYIVLMTDGENSTTSADTKTKAICDKARLDKIEVFTVAFMAPSRGQQLLSYCATSKNHYFEADDTASIISAFTKIGKTASKNLIRITN